MIVADDCWWLLVIIDNIIQLLIIADDYCWWLLLMIVVDDCWLLLMIIDWWWLLLMIVDWWWLLMIIADDCWLVMIIDDYCWWLLMISSNRLSGWWFQPLWKILVSWDYDIPNIWKNKIHVPNHQPDYWWLLLCLIGSFQCSKYLGSIWTYLNPLDAPKYSLAVWSCSVYGGFC